uniref:Uncharacterized protein LOC102806534 n=1 Tax=Saccoglossus kowalevskii TaxID=10224 RepID=A0ABM0MP32_SACKO|nr:PREDICTED: uncharacterized protein LOC102806534 [Saccoglossus kowalevskii]
MSIPMLFARGTNYEVGFQIGSVFKEKIQAGTSDVIDEVQDILQKFGGQQLYDRYLSTAKQVYPQYVEELQGMADGSGVTFDKLFLNLISVELYNMAHSASVDVTRDTTSEGCTDLSIQTDAEVLMTHTEDTFGKIKEGFLVNCQIVNPITHLTEEHFVSYCDPGVLPSDTFGFNIHGLVMTGNTIYQRYLPCDRIARRLVNRAVLGASSLQEVCDILAREPGVGAAFNLNLGCLGSDGSDPEIYSIEFANGDDGTLIDVQKFGGYNYRSNTMKRLTVECNSALGPERREARITQLATPKNARDLLEIMSDTADAEYPIYRSTTPPGVVETAAVVLFDLKRATMSVYKGNPKENCYIPIAVLPLRFPPNPVPDI